MPFRNTRRPTFAQHMNREAELAARRVTIPSVPLPTARHNPIAVATDEALIAELVRRGYESPILRGERIAAEREAQA